ncbi:hypothetical protein H257_06420 [Aphanomyces astaci]|uniref:Uncharacterized protein n=1 Tax=Aphanomyces astaci TaxID=112090 RepID=W4GPP3_APHAT|nr:hypothetical protein H257_06420 [Aphanomyces astaci]ETV80984.1 hypothetical protein H257_06420 [Aphanomyces astaci]|eukprot:XP_009829931.1 hypothetical protein H257_06420 [Aphanomyces astaci]
MSDCDEAKKKLQAIWDDPPANAPNIDDDGDASWGPVVLCAAITWDDFQGWLNRNEGRVRRWVFEPLADGTGKGRVVLYSISSVVHSKTAGRIATAIRDQVARTGNDFDLLDTVDLATDPTCRTGNHGQEPDMCIYPAGLAVGGAVLEAADNHAYPNVIVEIAYKNDDLDRLRAKLGRWMHNTSVQVAIGIKINAVNANRTAILCQRGQPNQEVAFGHPRLPPLAISFPLALIYTGVAMPPALAALANPQISIDLIALRTFIDGILLEEAAAH